MQIAIHQPEFMPWPGFFYKMIMAEEYVVLDYVQFKKRYFDNRNVIVSPAGEVSYISIPVRCKGRFKQPIHNVEIDNTQRWKDKILKKIRHFYSKAPYFEKYYQELNNLLTLKEYNYLLELNIGLINFFRKHLRIYTPMLHSSQMDIDGYKGSDLILRICLLKKADTYLAGRLSKDYLKEEAFQKDGIRIKWLGYKTPAYSQLCKEFVSDMSTLDLLFNHGERSRDILLNRA